MHSKIKGNIGETAVALNLMKKGYPVFRELGDNSKVDLIALVEDCPIKIQVKYLTAKNGVVELECKKSGPNYSFVYTLSQVDVFAVYILDKDCIFYISSKELLKHKGSMCFGVEKTPTSRSLRYIDKYLDFERVLRDYTPHTLPSNVEGDDIVQTTTDKSDM